MQVFKILFTLIKEGIGILIVIAAVVIFSYFDPFEWFTPKPKIENTALLLREVKAIQELITAEYYGETLTSWPRVFAESKEEEDEINITDMILKLNDELIEGNERESDKRGKPVSWTRTDVWRYYKRNLRNQYKDSELFKAIVRVVGGTDVSGRTKEKNAVFKIYSDGDEYLPDANTVKSIHRSFRTVQKDTRIERKKDAVCIARGIVRAGVDLSQIEKQNIQISGDVIYITNAPVKILAAELNPWFIPQRKVKGFELVKLKGKVDRNDINLLKKKCKELIIQQALDRKIKQEAKQNAEDALLNFFNLVFKSPVKEVVLVTDRLDELRIQYSHSASYSLEQLLNIYEESLLYALDDSDSTGYKDPNALKSFIESVRSKKTSLLISREKHGNIAEHLEYDSGRTVSIYDIKAYQKFLNRTFEADSAELTFISTYWLNGQQPDSIQYKTMEANLNELLTTVQGPK